jgi:hypothetical protein
MSRATNPDGGGDSGDAEWPEPHVLLYDDRFSDEFRKGIKALRKRRPDDPVRVAAVGGNYAFVALGSFDLTSLNEAWDQDEADAYVRVSTNFPRGKAYGIVTDPFLTRTDGKDVKRQHRNDNHAEKSEPLAEALGVECSDLGWWSYRWQNVTVTGGEDMTKAIALVQRRLSEREAHDA